jgi:hypothetical protein
MQLDGYVDESERNVTFPQRARHISILQAVPNDAIVERVWERFLQLPFLKRHRG